MTYEFRRGDTIPELREGSIVYDQFTEQGHTSPVRILSARDCSQFLRAVGRSETLPLDWDKGHAVGSRIFYEISVHPVIMKVVAALLGEDFMLWGASVQVRAPGAIHPWHSDIESSSAPPGKTVSVWIGLQHSNSQSSLAIVPFSHRFGSTLQEARHQFGKSRDETTDEDIIRWAQERDMRSHILKPEITDGEGLFFDGRLWHGSQNLFGKTRRAILLQYATPDTVIRIPDLNYLDWPFRLLNQPKPACLMVSGNGNLIPNRFVSPPVAAGGGSIRHLTSRIYPLQIPLELDQNKGWKPYPIFRGATATMQSLTCHVSVLAHGQCPHPPHTHEEEEILLLLTGEVDLVLPTGQVSRGDHRKRLRPGQFVYYPAHFPHTLETVSEKPANYLMFKWCNGRTGTDAPLRFGQFEISDYLNHSGGNDGFHLRSVFAEPTSYLRNLECHVSTLSPGAGYEPHVDAYDVAIITLEGEVETLRERVGPYSVIFYPAGEPHGMYNPGIATAKYVVFEFHSSQGWVPDPDSLRRSASLLAKLRDPKRVKRKLRSLVKRFTNLTKAQGDAG